MQCRIRKKIIHVLKMEGGIAKTVNIKTDTIQRDGGKIYEKKMKKVTALFLSLAMVMGMAGCSMEKETKEPETGTMKKEEGEKRIAFISPANQFDFFVYIGAEIKKIGEEKGVQVDMFDAALDVNKEADL